MIFNIRLILCTIYTKKMNAVEYEIFEKARKKAMLKILTEYHNDLMLEEIRFIEGDVPRHHREKFRNWHKEKTGVGRHRWAMFTINFNDDNKVERMLQKINKCCKKKWIEDYIWCLETRGFNDKNEPYGIHAHIRTTIRRNKKTYRCVGEVYNTFKDLVGNRSAVHCKYGDLQNCFVDYVKGISQGDTKHPESDKVFRKEWDLTDWVEGKN